MEVTAAVVTLFTLIGIATYLIGSLVISILRERRRHNVRKLWANFALSITFCALFLISWAGQGVTEWQQFRDQQLAHGEQATTPAFIVAFGQSTLENWQSEFLQLFSFVVLSALLIHRGSGESKDSDDRMEQKIDAIVKRLDELVRADIRR